MDSASNVQIVPSSSDLSSPISESPWEYEVFLSFRGEDTRYTFTERLYEALVEKGVVTFKDDEELEIGKPISPELICAIKKSRIAVVVLSRNYASSTSCLQELVKIVERVEERRMKFFPIFYHVDPSNVRHQRETFADAFVEHDKRFKENIKEVRAWRDVLKKVANHSGYSLKDGSESMHIQTIVGKISRDLDGTLSGVDEDNLVGMDSRVEKMLAQAVFKRIRSQFQASSFLNNVRMEHEKHGLATLQQQLLIDMKLKSEKDKAYVCTGIDETIKRLRYKKVLLVLDDVDNIVQLKTLAGNHNWFGSGSRIIITTKHRQLLKIHGVQNVYMAEKLNECDALQLFCQEAFHKPHCEKGLLDLCEGFISYADGHPLALTVLGSSLLGKERKLWESAWDRLKEFPDKVIQNTLQISFDALGDTEKKLFLDIACFFNGEEKKRVADILEGSGCYPKIDMENLIDKSLITILERKLWIHDLLQRVGWEIIRCQSPQNPGERSRLWLCDDVFKVLMDNTGTASVEGMMLNSYPHQQECLKPEAFSMMTNLRLLRIYNVHLPLGLSYLSNELHLMEWYAYPLRSIPRGFQPVKLVELIMPRSRFEQLPMGFTNLKRLKLLDLSDSRNLILTPDFTGFPNLEKLILQGCTRLEKVDPSVGALERLILLNLRDCKCLRSFPHKINLKSLEILILSGCSRLKKFPEIGQNMIYLSKLYLDGTAIEELPSSIEHLTNLVLLNLQDCKSLLSFPRVLFGLASLKSLILSGCRCQPTKSGHPLGLSPILSPIDVRLNFVQLISFSVLYYLILPNTYLRILTCVELILWTHFLCVARQHESKPINLLLPRSFSWLSSVVSLDLSDCNLLDGAFPDDLSRLSSLQSLNLSRNGFICLPNSISQLSKLKFLCLDNCTKLKSLQNLPISTQLVMARECTSLENYSGQVVVWTSGETGFTFINCLSLADDEECKVGEVFLLDSQVRPLWQRYMEEKIHQSQGLQSILPQTEIPKWFSHQKYGSSVLIRIPPDLYENSSWKGIVLCAIFVVHKDLISSISPSQDPYFHKFRLRLDMDGGLVDCPQVFSIPKDRFHAGSFGLWLYLSHERFRDNLDERNCISPSITTHSPDVEIKACGARILYDTDMAEFVQNLSENNFRIS
ncbi:disease resistance protein RUN1-like isoform X2 [Juglans microcarpa x Juglans regia]|uniref:disease resistance protein RUN1-like isoform X2 n=1 Tax=Juglans microcarpa x Juglans regia TaxID=2249226 RepID=UPI001B7E1402|nr:disease resistance protein RUN1-like isoform X2 [Juglans microcarpa x Juglans regia]